MNMYVVHLQIEKPNTIHVIFLYTYMRVRSHMATDEQLDWMDIIHL